MKGQGRYFSFSRLTDSSESLSLHSSSVPSPRRLLRVRIGKRPVADQRGFPSTGEKAWTRAAPWRVDRRGQQLPAGEGVAVYQDGGGARADWGGPAWVGRDKQGSPTLRCIFSADRPLRSTSICNPFYVPFVFMPIAWQSRAGSHGASEHSGRARWR
jgi:hypothetical protein